MKWNRARATREDAPRIVEVRDSASARDSLVSQLREANERLVIATMRAESLLSDAEDLAARLAASEKALRASEAQARSANRAKDQFLAMLGHELRNPLAPIVRALDLIAIDEDDPHRHEHAIIEAQVRHLTRLVDDLLEVSRIERGKVVLRRQPMELADAVSRAIEMCRPAVDEKQHTLRVDIPPSGLGVDGDLIRLTQVVANLLTNAAKYTPPGGTITICGERRGMRAILRVRDTGIGISPEMLPHIFELFAQEEQSADRTPGGLGLGLTIVRSLVALHGGTVTARSEGQELGSEFEIDLPALPRGEHQQSNRPKTLPRMTPRRILVVDDNRMAADLTGAALRKLGHDVRVVYDGPSALKLATNFTPDVALLDIGLPGMDGYELVQRLHDAWSSATVRYVAITGYGEEGDRERSSEAGFDAHLTKPVDLRTLLADIERAG